MTGILELAITLALSSSFFYGIGKVFDKKGLLGARLLVGVFYTLTVAVPILLLYSALHGDMFTCRYGLLGIAQSAISGILQLSIGTVFLYASIKSIGAARASVMSTTQVVFAPLLSIAFFGETISIQLLFGTSMIFLGLALVSFGTPSSQENLQLTTGRFGRGHVYGLLSGFFWGASYPLTRVASIELDSPAMASFFSYLFAVLTILIVLMFSRSKGKFELKRASKIYLSFSGTLRTIAILARSTALSLAPVVLVTPFASLSPLATVFLSYIIMQNVELINRNVVFGALAAVIGAITIALFA